MTDFTIELGHTSTAENPQKLQESLVLFGQKTANPETRPLHFQEFSRLLERGENTEIPNENSPFVYYGDSELNLSDEEIKSRFESISTEDFRRLRKGFLFKSARAEALKRISYEKEILKAYSGAALKTESPVTADRKLTHL